MVAGGRIEPLTLGYESSFRQRPKYLSFLKLQERRIFDDFTFFPIRYCPQYVYPFNSVHAFATSIYELQGASSEIPIPQNVRGCVSLRAR